jgi:hypothetical protein
MPVNDELVKKALAALTTAEDASGAAEDAEVTPGNVDPSTDQAQMQLGPEEEVGPTWSPFERRQYSRLGLDPDRLNFFQTLAGLRKGMGLESELLDRALSGQRQEFSDVDDLPLGKYS